MRIFGDNSDGFKNETDIENSLKEKVYDKLQPNLKQFLKIDSQNCNCRQSKPYC